MDALRQIQQAKGLDTAVRRENKFSNAARSGPCPDDRRHLGGNRKKTPDTAVSKLTHENVDINEENMELKSNLAQAEMQQTELTNSVNLLKSEKYELQTKLDMKDKQSKLLEAALNAKDRDLSSVRSISNDDGKSLADTQAELAALKRDHATAITDLQNKADGKISAI